MHSRYLIPAFVIAVAVIAAAWTKAQSIAVEKVTPTVMSGGDVGFRVEGLRGGTPVGRIVVRINGVWVQAELAGGVAPGLFDAVMTWRRPGSRDYRGRQAPHGETPCLDRCGCPCPA